MKVSQIEHSLQFYANGKFLITGEYVVLDGVRGLAVPLNLGQRIQITPRTDQAIIWKSFNADGGIWFHWQTTVNSWSESSSDSVTQKLIDILKHAQELAGSFILDKGCEITMHLDFDRQFGMGSSSTLISLIAQWFQVDPYTLQFQSFGGSGYDIACATSNGPIVYRYHPEQPSYKSINFDPDFKDDLFFVYLNQKQDSRQSIARFDKDLLSENVRIRLNQIPDLLVSCKDLIEFENILHEHEQLISRLIGLEPVQKVLFNDYTGVVKSLGGWGGDFVLATGDEAKQEYFKKKGYDVIYKWKDIVL